jgi:4-hydroxybenzoate polyprenyltransferase
MAGMSVAAHSIGAGLRETGEMIAFKHTVFALPFAVIAFITAAAPGWPPLATWLWVGVAMVAARTAAMAFNRLADHPLDAANPRTAERALPAGRLSRRFTWTVTIGSAGVFVIATANLNRLCLLLALPTLAVILGYSYSKRFTAAAHLWLGAALGIAPAGAWIAASGRIDWPVVVLSAAVSLWVAGFDIIYSLQDESFDRSQGLRSLPAVLGGRSALVVSRALHGLSLVGFAVFAFAAGGGPYRVLGVAAAAAMLVWQHRLVSAEDLRAVNAAFFTANGVLSVVMGLLFVVARLVEG